MRSQIQEGFLIKWCYAPEAYGDPYSSGQLAVASRAFVMDAIKHTATSCYSSRGNIPPEQVAQLVNQLLQNVRSDLNVHSASIQDQKDLVIEVEAIDIHSDRPTVNTTDLWTMIMCTLRYAMGRRSYITSLAADLVRIYKSWLEPTELDQIKRELKRELERSNELGRTLGDPPDHDVWKKLESEL